MDSPKKHETGSFFFEIGSSLGQRNRNKKFTIYYPRVSGRRPLYHWGVWGILPRACSRIARRFFCALPRPLWLGFGRGVHVLVVAISAVSIDLDGALLWLAFGRGVRVLVVAISAVSWYSCRSGVLQLPAGWLSEVQRV